MPAYIKAKQKLFDDLAGDNTYKILPIRDIFDPSIEKLPKLFFLRPQNKGRKPKLIGRLSS